MKNRHKDLVIDIYLDDELDREFKAENEKRKLCSLPLSDLRERLQNRSN